jgi:hypothetical protein
MTGQKKRKNESRERPAPSSTDEPGETGPKPKPALSNMRPPKGTKATSADETPTLPDHGPELDV